MCCQQIITMFWNKCNLSACFRLLKLCGAIHVPFDGLCSAAQLLWAWKNVKVCSTAAYNRDCSSFSFFGRVENREWLWPMNSSFLFFLASSWIGEEIKVRIFWVGCQSASWRQRTYQVLQPFLCVDITINLHKAGSWEDGLVWNLFIQVWCYAEMVGCSNL